MPENKITLTDVFKASMEREPGKFRTNTASCFSLLRYNKENYTPGEKIDDALYENVSHRMCDSARVTIKLSDEYVRIDYEFSSTESPDLRMLWEYLEEYGDLSDRLKEGAKPHFMVLALIPEKYMGRYAAQLMGPVFWSTIPRKPGGESYVRFRILFALKDVALIEQEVEDSDNEDSDNDNTTEE